LKWYFFIKIEVVPSERPAKISKKRWEKNGTFLSKNRGKIVLWKIYKETSDSSGVFLLLVSAL
jgi:hypothetical protein